MTGRTPFKRLAALALLAACAGLALPAAGQSSLRATWSAPIVLGPGWWQSLAVDVRGTVHVGWYSGVPGTLDEDALFYTFRPLGGEFAVPRDVIYTGKGGATVRNQLAVTTDGLLHLFFRCGADHCFAQALIDQADWPMHWSKPQQLDSGYYVTLLADDQDILHAVSSAHSVNLITQQINGQPISLESDPCAFCADLIYRRSTDGGRTWSQPQNLSNTIEGSEKPDIWQGPSGRLYVLWDEGFDWYIGRGERRGIGLVYSDDHGMTWSEPIFLEGDGRKPFNAAGVELTDGSLLVVWRSANDFDSNIYYQLSADLGVTWTDAAPINGIIARDVPSAVLDDSELIVDGSGITHLFVVARRTDQTINDELGVFHVEFRQNAWRAPLLVYQERGNYPEWPRAAVGPQNDIHLTWFNRVGEQFQGERRVLRVLYSYRSPTLPDRLTQDFRPTATLQPTATAARRFEPTATPFPTVVPIEQQVNVRTTSDLYAIQTLLSAAFVCLVLCGGVLALRGFRPRR